MHLREDVRWNDGVPVTAEDVKFSLDDQLRRVGVRMEIATFDRNALRERTDRAYDFEAAIAQYNFLTGFGEFRRSVSKPRGYATTRRRQVQH